MCCLQSPENVLSAESRHVLSSETRHALSAYDTRHVLSETRQVLSGGTRDVLSSEIRQCVACREQTPLQPRLNEVRWISQGCAHADVSRVFS